MRISLFLLIQVICISLLGCVPRYENNRYFGTWRLLDIDAPGTEKTGYVAVTDSNNLYFFTDEYSKAGIYQMNIADGTVKLLAEERDIGQLQLAEGKLFYSSFAEIYYGNKEMGDALGSKSYILKAIDLASGETDIFDFGYILGEEIEKYPDLGHDSNRGLFNFHYCGEDMFLISTVETKVPARNFEMITGFVYDKQFTTIDTLFKCQDFSDSVEHSFSNLYFNNNVMIISPVNHHIIENMLCTNELYIYDSKGDYGYRSAGAAYSAGAVRLDYPEQTVTMINNNQAIITAGNRIILCEPASGTVLDIIEIADAKGLMYAKSKSFILVYKENEKTESLYYLDTDDFSLNEIAIFDNEDIICIDEDYILTASKELIRKYIISEGEAYQVWEKSCPINLDQMDIAVEVCADWLFVKQFDGEKGVLCYKEKIN